MSYELKLKQQLKHWKEISALKDQLLKINKELTIINAQKRSLCQQLPILTAELYKLMGEYDKTW